MIVLLSLLLCSECLQSFLSDEQTCVWADISLFGLQVFPLPWWEKQIPHWIRSQPAELIWFGFVSEHRGLGHSGPTSAPTASNSLYIYFPPFCHIFLSTTSWAQHPGMTVKILDRILNTICGEKKMKEKKKKGKKRPLLDLSLLHCICMNANSSTNSSCTDSLECAYQRQIY